MSLAVRVGTQAHFVQNSPSGGTVPFAKYATTALSTQVLFPPYVAWPLPLYVTSTPESSCEAIQAAYWYGVAESPVAPTTTIGAAPLAVMSNGARPCTGHWTHAMLGPKYLPKIGAFFWSEVQSEKALSLIHI